MTTEPYVPNEQEIIEGSIASEAEARRGIAKIKADALREAAEESEQITCERHGGNDWFPSEWAGQVAGWLEHRADLIEEEA